jgi:hypothetical protein
MSALSISSMSSTTWVSDWNAFPSTPIRMYLRMSDTSAPPNRLSLSRCTTS